MNKTYSAILDYLSSVVDSIPCTINSPDVTHIWETPTGKKIWPNKRSCSGS